ncbi:hypothetical protein BJX63DRAFT_432363 [Aspergillus granulosus]|uniref:LysM domain-containing protein n=1 Tax=Aspergillus granulosus TaxID=176169 RepID=A0ABR4HBK7_9EURO
MKIDYSALLLAFVAKGHAQVFENLLLGVEYPGLSDACVNALNTTVSCPPFLSSAAENNPRLSSEQLVELCTPSCQASLSSARQKIAQSCNQDSDIISYDGLNWPATMIIVRFIYTNNLSCRKIREESGKYCDEIFVSWLNQSSLTAEQSCSDCMLGATQIQLNSPFGYSDDFAADFSSLTSSCGATGYPFTSSAVYALPPSSTESPDSIVTPTCSSPYHVQAGDSCDSIALAHNVSTHAILVAGDLSPTCSNMQAGSALCLPDPCDLYRVQDSDTCDSIVAAHSSVNDVQLLNWNLNINMICGNIAHLVGTLICVSSPGGPLPSVTVTESLPGTTAATAEPKPTNAPPESTAYCGRCLVIPDFYFLNPGINANCTNLLLGLAYCVQPVGDIAMYTSNTTTPLGYTLTSIMFSIMLIEPLPSTQPTIEPPAPFPSAPGTLEDCLYPVQRLPLSLITDQSQLQEISFFTPRINTCESVAAVYGVDPDHFLIWNPSFVSLEECELQENYTYCASNGTFPDPADTEEEYSYCLDVENVLPGTSERCTCFTEVTGPADGFTTCADVVMDFDITVDDLLTWNTWLVSDCDAALFDGLGEEEDRAICVRVASGDTTSTSPTSTTSQLGTTTTSTSIGPTQSGTAPDCTQYHTVVSGDSCADILAQFDITIEQFYAWNPTVGSNCQNLWLDYAYCVSSPSRITSSMSTTSPTAMALPGPIRPGTPEDCTEYYVVQSGDGCWAISDAHGIDVETLYAWNPSIGSDCGSIWPDYALCVAGGPVVG